VLLSAGGCVEGPINRRSLPRRPWRHALAVARRPSGEAASRRMTPNLVAQVRRPGKQRLSPAAFAVLRRAHRAAIQQSLDKEKPQGHFVCCGCQLPCFSSSAKISNSRTAWPSFLGSLPNAVVHQTCISKLTCPRTTPNADVARGHQGHVVQRRPPVPPASVTSNNGCRTEFSFQAGKAVIRYRGEPIPACDGSAPRFVGRP